ncbi:hypothetical protein CAEBREN_01142 [Caenorhabditis brenneri]|uniref:Peptidase S1 domain-containing protein n=1 Tax=Caenorhabditis brenneri TaxID=135651 RepID=G0MJ28_CAEBE|nr:hypothetical protein CAEBREN_01142 [Caenorhabditis brenneri]
MKVQSLLSILSIFIVIVDSRATSRPLNDRENQERLSTCGVDRPDSTWFWVMQYKDPYGHVRMTGASKISRRHFITFSHLLIVDRKWRTTGKLIGSGCENGKSSLQVPNEELSSLKFRTIGCFDPNHSREEPCQEATPLNAYLLNFCDQVTPDIKYTPMIVEVKASSNGKNKNLIGNELCLMGSESDVKKGDQVKAHSLDDVKGFGDTISVVSGIDAKLILLPNIPDVTRYGGPLLNMDKWRVKLIGYSDSAGICEESEYPEELGGPVGSGTKKPRKPRKPTTPYPGEKEYDYEEYEDVKEDRDKDYFGVWTENSVRGNRESLESVWMTLMVLHYNVSRSSTFKLVNPNWEPSLTLFKNTRNFYFPMFCSNEVRASFEEEYSPMILEFVEEQNSPVPCLGAGDLSKQAIDMFLKDEFKQRSITVKTSTPHFYSTDEEKSGDNLDEGRVLEQEINGKLTVIGIKTRKGLPSNNGNLFYRMDWLEDSLCELVGICKEEDVTVTVSTEPSSSTHNPPTEIPTTPSSTETSRTLESSKPPETTTPPESPVPIPTHEVPLASPSPRTMPPEYVDHGDYDMIFDSLYEFPEFREIEETPYEKKGCYRSFELVLMVLFLILVYKT